MSQPRAMESIQVAIEVNTCPYHSKRNSRCCNAASAGEFNSA